MSFSGALSLESAARRVARAGLSFVAALLLLSAVAGVSAPAAGAEPIYQGAAPQLVLRGNEQAPLAALQRTLSHWAAHNADPWGPPPPPFAAPSPEGAACARAIALQANPPTAAPRAFQARGPPQAA
ncbi:MAG: hypothetical protein JNK94_04515 [Hyphomonadaceae bacterium]|nr:hypothetical protein [Hyphomonadaceae bacterium]MBX3510990.1 hypothetical protein [Hyphomonadaceae bacterium]